jgi:hypothetical protein
MIRLNMSRSRPDRPTDFSLSGLSTNFLHELLFFYMYATCFVNFIHFDFNILIISDEAYK